MPSQTPEVKKLLQSLRKDQDKLSPENQELVKTLTVKEEKKEEKEKTAVIKSNNLHLRGGEPIGINLLLRGLFMVVFDVFFGYGLLLGLWGYHISTVCGF